MKLPEDYFTNPIYQPNPADDDAYCIGGYAFNIEDYQSKTTRNRKTGCNSKYQDFYDRTGIASHDDLIKYILKNKIYRKYEMNAEEKKYYNDPAFDTGREKKLAEEEIWRKRANTISKRNFTVEKMIDLMGEFIPDLK